MSKEDKQKLDNLVESQAKIESNLRMLGTQIRNFNLDDIKDKLKQLPNLALK